MNSLAVFLETIRLEWRMLFSRPTVVIAPQPKFNVRGEQTRTTSRCAWN